MRPWHQKGLVEREYTRTIKHAYAARQIDGLQVGGASSIYTRHNYISHTLCSFSLRPNTFSKNSIRKKSLTKPETSGQDFGNPGLHCYNLRPANEKRRRPRETGCICRPVARRMANNVGLSAAVHDGTKGDPSSLGADHRSQYRDRLTRFLKLLFLGRITGPPSARLFRRSSRTTKSSSRLFRVRGRVVVEPTPIPIVQ